LADTETLVYLIDLQIPDLDSKTTSVQNFKKALEEIPAKGKETGEGLHHANEGAKDLSEGLRGGSEAIRKWTEEFGALGINIPVFNTALTGATQASRTFVSEGLAVASVAAFGVAIAGAAAELVALGAEWGELTSTLVIQSGQSRESVQGIVAALGELASTDVSPSQRELTEALSQVIGRLQNYTGTLLSAADAARVMGVANDLAESTGGKLDTSTVALVQAMMAAHGSFEDMSHIADVLSSTYKLTGVSAEQMATAIGRLEARLGSAAPAADQLATVLAILGQAGLTGSRGLMLAYQVLDSLASPTENAKHAMETLGVEVEKTASGQIDAVETIKNLKSAIENINDPTQRHAALVDIAGQNYGLLENLIRPTVAQIEAMHEAVNESNAAHERAEVHSDDLKERLAKLGNQAAITAANFGGVLAQALIQDADLMDKLGSSADATARQMRNAALETQAAQLQAAASRGNQAAAAALEALRAQYNENNAHLAADRAGQKAPPEQGPWETGTQPPGYFPAGGIPGSAVPSPEAATGTYESAEQKKSRLEQEKIATNYEAEQRLAASDAAREQSRFQERLNQQVEDYNEKYGAGVGIGGKILENLERESELRERQFQAAQAILEVENAHADAIDEIKQGWEDVDRATKDAREDSRHQIEVDREIAAHTEEMAHAESEYKISQDRTASDYQKQNAREDADYEKSLRREASTYIQQTAREDADYQKSQARESADYATQLGRQKTQESVSNSRSDRDAAIEGSRSREDLAREHSRRLAEIQRQGGPNAGSQIAQENASYQVQLENLSRAEGRRQQDEQRHRADRQQDETTEQSYHTADMARTRARHDEDVKLSRDRHAEDLKLRLDYHAEDTKQRRQYHAEDLVESNQRHAADMGRAAEYWQFQFDQRQAYYGEDTEAKRGDQTTDIESARARQAFLRDEQRAHQLDMTAGSGGARDQIERAYGIAPEQIAAANAQRQKQEAYLTLQRDLTQETAANQERIAAATERQAAAYERVQREYAEKGGNPASLPAPVVPGAPVPNINVPQPGAPQAPGGGSPSVIDFHMHMDGATFIGGDEASAQRFVALVSPALLSSIRGNLMAGRAPG
jgi:TP901 family phage tail tape measure protein